MATQNIGRRAVSFLEQTLTQKCTVLAVRAWQPATFYEVDIHLPGATNMANWQKAQRIIMRVAPLTYRDYTPAGWDGDTRTCTLYIDAGHKGPGSSWVKNLQAGDVISYVAIDSAHQTLTAGSHAVFLGDQSAIGHFLALQQIAGRGTEITGAIHLTERTHAEQYAQYLPALPLSIFQSEKAVLDWIDNASTYSSEAIFYLVGRSHFVAELRRKLRERGIRDIKAQGFWK